MTRSIRKSKHASCSKKPAATTSRWSRNNALLPFHIRAVRGGGHAAAGTARPAFQQAAALHFPGHGAATEASATEGQCVLYQWHQFATAGPRNHSPQRSDSNREREG